MQSKRVEKTYDKWKAWYHAKPWAVGKELHHVFPGRVGFEKCCPILMQMLFHPDHESWEIKKHLRNQRREDWHKVKKNYDKRVGCSEVIYVACQECPMCNKRTKGE